MMTIDDKRGGRGVKNAEKLMTSYVNDPLFRYKVREICKVVKHGAGSYLSKVGCVTTRDNSPSQIN